MLIQLLKVIIPIIIVLLLILLLLSIFPRPAATVILTPKSQLVSDLPIINVTMHQLSSTQQSSQTNAPTGQPKQGTHATGILTFENSTFSKVTIPAGTSITSTTGEEIVTDIAIEVPPDPIVPGIASVTAHAVKIGSSGNIQSMSINKPCCSSGIIVLNKSAFSGGIDTQTTPTVQQNDIDSIANTLETSLTQKALSDIQTHLISGERLLYATPQCSPKVTSTPKVGESATEFTVNVSLACSESAYNLQTVQLQAEDRLKQKAIQLLGPGFIQAGAIETTIAKVTEGKNGQADVQASTRGKWSYQFTATNKLDMVKYIARKTKSDALRWLKQQARVADASISIKGPILSWGKNDALPDDLRAITIH